MTPGQPEGGSDSNPYDIEPGFEPSDFLTPMDPDISWTSTIGMPWEDLMEIYGRSAGGVGIDLGPLGLNRIRFVRISVPDDAFLAPEIDGLADVPPQLPADLDGDQQVNVNDLLMLLELGLRRLGIRPTLTGMATSMWSIFSLMLEAWTQ